MWKLIIALILLSANTSFAWSLWGTPVRPQKTKGIADMVVAASDSSAAVKAQADYVCSGADDQVEINAAIDAGPGGKVVLSSGRFNISSTIILKAHLQFEGAKTGGGASAGEGTIIYLADGSDCSMLEFEKTIGAADPDFLRVKSLYLFGNNINNAATSHGVWIHGDADGTPMDIVLEDLFVHGFNDNGFHIDAKAGTDTAWGVYVYRCLSETNGGYGFYGILKQCYIVTGYYAYNEKSGFILGSPSEEVMMTNVYVRMSGWHGFQLAGVTNLILTGCTAYENSEGGTYDNFLIQNCPNLVMVGCVSADDADSNVDNGIFINGAVTSGTITGCSVHDVTTGIRIDNSPQADVILSGNSVEDNDTDYVGVGGGLYTLDDGKVGIGVIAPSSELEVVGTLTVTDVIIDDNSYVGSASDADAIQIEADGDVVLTQGLTATGDITGAADIILTNAGGATIGTTAQDQDLTFSLNDGGVTVTPLYFDADSAGVPRFITDYDSGYAARFFNDGGFTTRYGIRIQSGNDASTGTSRFVSMYDGDGTAIGYLVNDDGVCQIDQASDRRLKENIRPSTFDALQKIEGLSVKDFNFKDNKSGTVLSGFIAQEVAEIWPDAVGLVFADDDPNRNPDELPTEDTGYYMIGGTWNQQPVPIIWKALQELNETVKEQARQIKGLERQK